MRRAIALAVFAVIARSEVARAGSCSGGSSGSSSSGGSSDSSSSGSSSSDSSSSDSSSSSTPACVDDTDVVGYRKCSRYGQWADNTRKPAIAIEVGMAMRHVAPTLGERSGSITHETESFAYRIVEPRAEPAVDTALVFTGRAAMGMGRGFYVGVEGETGVLAEPRGQAQMMESGERGMPTIEAAGRPSVFGALGVVGYRGTLGRASFSLEAAAGARMTKYTYVSRYLACETTEEIYALDEVVEARARLEWWATPFVTVGASVGGSALELGDAPSGHALVGGAYVGFHSRAFGGGR